MSHSIDYFQVTKIIWIAIVTFNWLLSGDKNYWNSICHTQIDYFSSDKNYKKPLWILKNQEKSLNLGSKRLLIDGKGRKKINESLIFVTWKKIISRESSRNLAFSWYDKWTCSSPLWGLNKPIFRLWPHVWPLAEIFALFLAIKSAKFAPSLSREGANFIYYNILFRVKMSQ